MTDSKQVNVRLPEITRQQLDALAEKTGLTLTQLIIMAVDRMADKELAPTKKPRK